MIKTIRILIADDHNVVRQGIINLIESNPELIIVAEAADGQTMIEKYSQSRPDVVVTDLNMPKMNGLEAGKIILSKDSSAKIIFLTINNTDEYIYEGLRIGAKGLIGKNILKGELIRAIQIVADGGTYFMGKSDDELALIKKQFDERDISGSKSLVDKLDPREKQILNYLSMGLTSEEIAGKLFISKRTVELARSKMMEKLKIKSFHQMIRFAVEYSFKNKD